MEARRYHYSLHHQTPYPAIIYWYRLSASNLPQSNKGGIDFGNEPAARNGGPDVMAGIEIADGVAANRGAEAARLLPLRAVRATVDWPLPPDDSEETILPDVVAALSRALAACGSVAFRYDEPLEGATIYHPPPKQSVKDRLLGLAGLGNELFGLAVALDPAVIGALFAYDGWSFAVQSALVFDPAADPSPILDALRLDLDWRGRTLPEGARLLFGPGHDGDFAVVAAADPVWLERFKAASASG